MPAGRLAPLAIGALGVVFGDIGTSPLYTFREAFHGAAVTLSLMAYRDFDPSRARARKRMIAYTLATAAVISATSGTIIWLAAILMGVL